MKSPPGADPNDFPASPANTLENPGEGASDDEPMTAAQASCLKTLSEEALEHEAFDETLTQAEASKRINALEAKLRLMGRPPHVA